MGVTKIRYEIFYWFLVASCSLTRFSGKYTASEFRIAHEEVNSQYIPPSTKYPPPSFLSGCTLGNLVPIRVSTVSQYRRPKLLFCQLLDAYFSSNFYKTFLVPDFHYLPGQHPGFGPFALFPAAQWLDTAAYMGYPWPEYFRRPTTTELCKLPSTCASSLVKSK
jgi:hypothetical protein